MSLGLSFLLSATESNPDLQSQSIPKVDRSKSTLAPPISRLLASTLLILSSSGGFRPLVGQSCQLEVERPVHTPCIPALANPRPEPMASEKIAMWENSRRKVIRNTRTTRVVRIPYAKNLVRMFHARSIPLTKTSKTSMNH